MEFKTILFPTDFSPAGDAALNMAASLARDNAARLLIVHVEEPPTAYGSGEIYYGFTDPDMGQLFKRLQKVAPKDPSVKVEHKLLNGDPANALLRAVDEEGVDLIVMSTHGRSGVVRLLMGSVTEAVLRQATCPVLTVKQPVLQETS